MALIIHNETQSNKIYAGQLIPGDNSYQILDSELSAFRQSDNLISDLTLATPEASIEDSANPGVNITGSDAVNLLLGQPERDSDGALISRTKVTETGWQYHMQGVEFTTSTIGSSTHPYNHDEQGNNLGFASVKLYDDQDQEITTQIDADTNCVKTIIDWEPTYDYEVIGGALKMDAPTLLDVRVYVIAVPDIPKIYGGSKDFISSINMKYIASGDKVEADGRASKRLYYDAVNHTNKMRIILKHPAGAKCNFLMSFELFKE